MISSLAARYFDPVNEFDEIRPVVDAIIDEYEAAGEELPLLLQAYKNLDSYPEDIRTAIKIALIISKKYGDHVIRCEDGVTEIRVLKTSDEKFMEVENGHVRIDYRGFAEFLAKKYAIIHFNGVFYVWDGSKYIDYDNVIDSVIYHHLVKMGFPREKRATIYVAEVRKQIQYLCSVREFPFNKHNGRILIPVKNGVLWWDNGEVKLIPNSPLFGFTYCINVNYIPGCRHDRIRKFLECLVNQEDLEILYEIPAACLVRTHFPYAYFIYGTGSNGKSTYLNLITDLLGPENVSHVSLQDLSTPSMRRFRTAALIGKLANIFPDLPSTTLYSTDTFKALTGDDYITVERKFKEPFSFKNTARLIFSANEFPRTRDESDAFWRRWIIVKFPNKFRNNPRILEDLTTDEEKSAFLDEILKRLSKILECNPTINADARSEWIRSTDSVRAFLEDCTQEDKDAYVVKDDLYNAYVEYCNAMGYDAVSSNSFFRRISKMYPTFRPKVGNKQKRAYRGIRLLPREQWPVESEEVEEEPVEEIRYKDTERLIAFLNDENDGNDRDDESNNIKYVKIRLIRLPVGTDKVEFVGVDGREYSISPGDVVDVPEENARPMVERGYAVKLRVPEG